MSSVEKQKANRSTAPRKDEARHGTGTTGRALTSTADRKLASGEAGTQALPVDTHSRAQFDRLKYQREYMRDRNTIKRLGLNMTVGEWRKSKGLD